MTFSIRSTGTAVLTLAAACASSACSFDTHGSLASGAGTGSTSGGMFPLGGSRGTIGGGQGGTTGSAPPPVPIMAADVGGYGLGAPVSAGTTNGGIVAGTAGCNTIVGVLRDFQGKNVTGGHPDFEAFSGSKATPGIIGAQLDVDRKPVYASPCDGGAAMNSTNCPYGQMSTSKANFDEWYSNLDGVNKPYLVYFQFAPNGGASTFSSTSFFPLDDAGWGNSGMGGKDNKQHNFHFTTELHTTFRYNGGEHFTFTGDDDLWVFINGKLAMDLGGVHPQVTGTVDLDTQAAALGITPGSNYPMELFHAERHTSQSNFRVDTNLVFVDCGIIIP